jgi:hypothetical protein
MVMVKVLACSRGGTFVRVPVGATPPNLLHCWDGARAAIRKQCKLEEFGIEIRGDTLSWR